MFERQAVDNDEVRVTLTFGPLDFHKVTAAEKVTDGDTEAAYKKAEGELLEFVWQVWGFVEANKVTNETP